MTTALEDVLDPQLVAAAQRVRRVRFEGPATMEAAIATNEPVIIEGAVDDWKAMSDWTFDEFRKRWGENEAKGYQRGFPLGRSPYEVFASDVTRRDKVSRWIDRIEDPDAKEPVHLTSQNMDAVFPGARDDIRYASLFVSPPKRISSFAWLGSAGSRTGLHWDGHDNLIALYKGEKVFALAPPGNYRRMYAMRETHPSKSAVDPGRVDWDRFEQLRRARFVVGVLGAGDVLFLPCAWWHYVISTQPSIGTNAWFGPPKKMRIFHTHGPEHVVQFVRDFAVHGVLRRPYHTRALSPPPWGLMAYDFMADFVVTRVTRGQQSRA